MTLRSWNCHWRSAPANQNAKYGPAVALKPVVVTADRIHDTRLLAVYGLFEHDVGDDAKARELLEAAAKAGVERPKAYLVLAELRYSEAIAKPLGSQGRLSADQAASILGPLRTALHSAPTLEAYTRILQVWDHCEARPAEGDVQTFAEGVELFPRDIGLSYRSAVMCARNGHSVVAARLLSSGLLFATDDGDREKLEQLRAAMAIPRVPGSQ